MIISFLLWRLWIIILLTDILASSPDFLRDFFFETFPKMGTTFVAVSDEEVSTHFVKKGDKAIIIFDRPPIHDKHSKVNSRDWSGENQSIYLLFFMESEK